MDTLAAVRHLNRIDEAVAAARYAIRQYDELERDEVIMQALAMAFHREYAGLIEVLTGESADAVAACQERLIDETAICLMDAIDKRDDRNSPESIASAKADAERAMA